VKRGGVVDAVSHIAHDVARFFESNDNPFLLVGLHLREYGDLSHLLQQGAVTELMYLRPG